MFEEFNASEALKDFDPTISKTYCGPGKKYQEGTEFQKLSPKLQQEFRIKYPYQIGQYVDARVYIGEADPVTEGTKSRYIGRAEIIDIISDTQKEWRLRVRYIICSSYNGNTWPHYSDVLLRQCFPL